MKHLILFCLITFTLSASSQSTENEPQTFSTEDLISEIMLQKSEPMTGVYKIASFDSGLRLQCGIKLDPELKDCKVVSAHYSNDTLNLNLANLNWSDNKNLSDDQEYFYLFLTIKGLYSIPKTILINSQPMIPHLKNEER